jgi:hypothetical protein
MQIREGHRRPYRQLKLRQAFRKQVKEGGGLCDMAEPMAGNGNNKVGHGLVAFNYAEPKSIGKTNSIPATEGCSAETRITDCVSRAIYTICASRLIAYSSHQR